MQKSLMAGLDLPEMNNPRTTAVPTPARTPDVPRVPTMPPQAPATAPVPSATIPHQSIPIPGQMPSSPLELSSPPEGGAASAAGGRQHRRKAGRPRLHPERVLTGREKAARYRQARKAVAAKALSGDVDVATMSHKDLGLAVAQILNRQDDLALRQTGYPLVRELQRRLKGL